MKGTKQTFAGAAWVGLSSKANAVKPVQSRRSAGSGRTAGGRDSVHKRCLGCGAKLGIGHAIGEFDQLQAAGHDVEDAEVCDDAVDHALTCQRQGAAFQHLGVAVLAGVVVALPLNQRHGAFSGLSCP